MNAPMAASGRAPRSANASSGRQSLMAKIIRSPMAAISLATLVIITVATILGPWLAPHDAHLSDITRALESSSAEHWLGTDSAGRDIFSRLLVGGGVTLGGAGLALAVAIGIGVTFGLISGYHGGGFDLGAEWGNNLLMALPNIMVLLAVRAAFGNNVWLSMTVLGVLLAPGFYRLTRNIVMGVRNELYVDAARVSGLGNLRILGRHVLGAVRAPIIIHAALTGVAAIGTQAGLQFLGLADTSGPAWGSMLNEALVNLYIAPGLMLWPGIALGLVNAALILFGNGLRDALEDRPARAQGRRTRAGTALTLSVAEGGLAADLPGGTSPDGSGTVVPEPLPGHIDGDRTDAGSHGDGEHVTSPGDAGAPAWTSPRDAPLGDAAQVPQEAVLAVWDLRIGYPSGEGTSVVVDGVTLGVCAGEVLGLVGESGSGKTQTAWAMLNLLPREAQVLRGELEFDGTRYAASARGQRNRLLGTGIAYIPQEPMSNLDPSFTVGYQLVEPMRARLGLSRTAARGRALDLLARVGIPEPQRTFDAYPHQISGGMAQRVLIAGAVSCDPQVLIADEPTTALDVTVQAEVLDLLRDLQEERGMAVILVTHNLGVVADICDRVAVMQRGRLVEHGGVDEIFDAPRHAYTRMLLDAVLEDKEPRTTLLADPAEAAP